MKFRPLHDRVVVKRVEEEGKTKGGIIIPDTAKEKPMEGEIVALFRNVLLICDAQGLIGRDMFAIDGCKLPSNASKEWSGTKAELNAKRIKLEREINGVSSRIVASQ